MSAPDPSAEALDEAATVALLEEDFAFAFETARRAVEKDRFLGHAYDTMVIAGRASGKKKYESTAAALAAKNGMVVPLYEREKTSRVLENAKVTLADADDFERPKKWWQFWR
jgi:hypothetical protein